MPKIGRMNKSEIQTVFDPSEMKHQTIEKDKQKIVHCYNQIFSYPIGHLVRVLESVVVV